MRGLNWDRQQRWVFTLFVCVLVTAATDGCSESDGSGMPGLGETPGLAGVGATAGTPAAGSPGTSTATAGRGVAGTSGGAAGRAAAGAPAPMTTAGRAADADDAGVEPADAGAMTPDTGVTVPPEQPPTRADLGKGDGSDVITIGDSWMNLGSTGIQQSLLKASGQKYRTYGRGGTRLLDDVIPNQYATAKRADADIKTVVMTGGGNDIIQVPGLRDDCTAMGAQCEMVKKQILERLTTLWDLMSTDGVQDVLYVQYSNPEGQNVDFALAGGMDSVKTRCAAVKAPMHCHTLETLDIVMGDIPDSIHPSAVAFDRVGKAVFDLMTKEGMRR
jgi:hypothetical protein